MSITTRSGDNFNYSTAASLISVNGDIIRRTGLTANSADVISIDAIDLMLGYLNSTSVDYNGNSFTVTIQNSSTLYTITQSVGAFDAVLATPGTGYSDATGVATTGGSGTGMTVDITQTGGAIDTVTINDSGSGYLVGDTITVSGGTGGTFTIALISSGITMLPTSTYTIPPEGSATFTFIKDSTTAMTILVKDSGVLYSPVGTVSDNTIVRFDGTTGNMTQSSVVSISDTGAIEDALSLELNGTTSGSVTLQAGGVVSTYSLTLPLNSGTFGQVLSTDGTGVTSWVSNTSPDSRFYAFGPAVSAVLSGTFTTVNVVNSITGAGYSNASGVVTIVAAGTYQISYTAQFESLNNQGGATGSFGAQLLLGAGVVGGSITECFIQEQNGNLHRPSCSKTVYAVVTANQTLALQVSRTAGTTTGQTRVNQCTLSITQVV